MLPISACLALLLLMEFASAHKQCPMPGGIAGECRPLKQCKPLWELNKKRVKTEKELLYIAQSKCGIMANFDILVCCPRESVWSTFKNVEPQMFKEIIIDEKVGEEKDDDATNKILKPAEEDNINKSVDTKDVASFRSPIRDQTAAISECGREYSNTNRIIGGGVTNIDQYPWLVLLEYNENETLCGGSLISTKYVLTAAHCIVRQVQPQFARLAEYNTTSYPTDYVDTDGGGTDEITVDRVPIERNIAHPNYTRIPNTHHDIGLSKLAREAVLGDFIKLICLPTRDWVIGFQEPMNFTVAGWGSDGQKPSEVKKHVKVPYVKLSTCKSIYVWKKIVETQICAGGVLNEDSCSGDSGGPLMYDNDNIFIAVGIVSYGVTNCGTEDVPGVYTYVYPYLNWLYENMM